MTGTVVNSVEKVWNEDTTKLLIALWDEGLSAGKIALQIPYATRNAIIGKAHRMGLPARKQNPSIHPGRIVEKRERKRMPVFRAPPPPPLLPPDGDGIPFLKATMTTCRSVEGYSLIESGHTLAVFCSNPKSVDESYCPYHRNIYYRKDCR